MPPINGFAKANSLDRIIEIGQQSNYVSKPSEESAPKTGDEKLAPPPQNPAVPGGRIYSDAIAHADELPGAGTAVTDADRTRADATARALGFKGLDDFIARLREHGGPALAPGGALVKNLPDPDATLTLVAVRLLNSDAVAWKADRIGNGVDGKVNDYDKIVDEIDDCIGRGITPEKLLAAAQTTVGLVNDGRLEPREVAAFVNESRVDVNDARTMYQTAARATSAIRREILEGGWGKLHRLIASKLSGPDRPHVSELFGRLNALADKARRERNDFLAYRGLDLPQVLKPGVAAGEPVETAISRAFAGMHERFKAFDKAVAKMDSEGRGMRFAATEDYLNEVHAFLRENAATLPPALRDEISALLREAKIESEPKHLVEFLKSSGTAVTRELEICASITERIGYETDIRQQMEKAVAQLKKDGGGLVQPGRYNITFAVALGGKLGAGGAVGIGVKAAVSMQIAIGQDGSASFAKSVSFGGYVKGKVAAGVATAKLEGSVTGKREKSFRYPDIDSMAGDVGRLAAPLITERGILSIFRSSPADVKSLAYRADNRTFRNVLENMGLLDRTDAFLTGPMNAKVRDYALAKSVDAKASAKFETNKKTDSFFKSAGFSIDGSASFVHKSTASYSFSPLSQVVRKDPSRRAEEFLVGFKATAATDPERAKEDLRNRLKALRAELDDFSRSAIAVQHLRGSVRNAGVTKDSISFARHLANRKVTVGVGESLRAFFTRTRQSTLATKFLASLAREAAAVESYYRELLAADGGELPVDAAHDIRMLDDAIYENQGFRITQADSKETLFVSSKKEKTSNSVQGSVKLMSILGKTKVPFLKELPLSPNLELKFSRTFGETKGGAVVRGGPPYAKPGSLSVSFAIGELSVLDNVVERVLDGIEGGHFGVGKLARDVVDRGVLKEAISQSLKPLVAKFKSITDAAEKAAEETGGSAGSIELNYLKTSGHTLTLDFAMTGDDGEESLTFAGMRIDHTDYTELEVAAGYGAFEGKVTGSRFASRQVVEVLSPRTFNGIVRKFGELHGPKWTAWLGQNTRLANSLLAFASQWNYTGIGNAEIQDRNAANLCKELKAVYAAMAKDDEARAKFEAAMRDVYAWKDGQGKEADPLRTNQVLTKLLEAITEFYGK